MRQIEARHRQGGGLTYREAVNVARKRVRDGEMYLISRHGGWLRPNAQGYTTLYAEAGIFNADTARSYLGVEGLSVMPLSEARAQIATEAANLERQVANLAALAARFEPSDLEPPKMSLEYPEDMPPALADALSLMNFQTGPIAHIYRAAGHNIPTKCEAEQAFVLHRCIKLALTHGEDWRKHAQAEINDIKAKLKPSAPKTEAQNG